MRDAGIIYWADVFMGFATGFVVIYNLRRRVIRRPVSIAEYYVRYGTFWPDFLASLPTIAEARPSQALLFPLCGQTNLRLLDTSRLVSWGYAPHVIAGIDQGIVRKACES